MKLYELDWALYPRRIGIYLAEKGITDIERVALDAMAPETASQLSSISFFRTVPVLETQDGHKIRTSIAILEYLEEQYPEPNLIGQTALARARTREATDIAGGCTAVGIWAHKGSPVFTGSEDQHATAARYAAKAYLKELERLDLVLDESGGPFLTGADISITDCIAMTTVQFAADGYGVALPARLGRLSEWYALMQQRPSAVCPAYPEPFLERAYGLPSHGLGWSFDDPGWNTAAPA
ncbi:glutathione S-transferase family protein [Vreelandella sp. EE27]